MRTLSPQVLRRTFSNTIVSETGDIVKVRSIGGWKGQRSLQRYLARRVETDKQVMEVAWQRLKGDKTQSAYVSGTPASVMTSETRTRRNPL